MLDNSLKKSTFCTSVDLLNINTTFVSSNDTRHENVTNRPKMFLCKYKDNFYSYCTTRDIKTVSLFNIHCIANSERFKLLTAILFLHIISLYQVE